jgi:hypothetical protein
METSALLREVCILGDKLNEALKLKGLPEIELIEKGNTYLIINQDGYKTDNLEQMRKLMEAFCKAFSVI